MMHTRERSQRRFLLFALLAGFCILLVAIYFRAGAGGRSHVSEAEALLLETRVVQVASRAELRDALKDEQGGFTVLLAPGNYGHFKMRASAEQPRFAELVTIKSAEPCNPALFERMTITGVANLALESLHFESAGFFDRPREEVLKPNGQMRNLDLLRTDDVTDLAVRDSTFVGPTVNLPSGHRLNGYGYGFGWRGMRVRNVSFSNNSLTNLYKGLSVRNAAGLTISDNTLRDYRSDGIYLTESEDVSILNNRLVDPRPLVLPRGRGDHPDFMQLARISGGRIENNYMDIGMSAEASQGIFSGPAEDMVVRNNVIITRSLNGLIFSTLANSDVSNNVVVSAGAPSAASNSAPAGNRRNIEPQFRINANYENVTVSNNLASRYDRRFRAVAQADGLDTAGNVTLQDRNPLAEGFYAYGVGDAAAEGSAGTRIGNLWLGAVPPNTGPDPSKFAYLQSNPVERRACRR